MKNCCILVFNPIQTLYIFTCVFTCVYNWTYICIFVKAGLKQLCLLQLEKTNKDTFPHSRILHRSAPLFSLPCISTFSLSPQSLQRKSSFPNTGDASWNSNIRRERFSGALNNLLFHNRQRHSYMCRKTNVCCSIVITLQGQCVGWVYSCGKLSITDGIVGHRQNPRFVTSHKTRTTPQRCPPFARMDICTHLNTN